MSVGLTNYQLLNQLVRDGKLEMIRVVGLPRSNGTALHLLLTQAPDVTGQINEPFYYPDMKGRKWSYRPQNDKSPPRTFEDGCAWLVKEYEKRRQEQEKVKLIVHDLSQDLTDKEFSQLCQIDSHTIFMVRDPIMNALSMFTRYVNDKLSQPGGKKLSSVEVLELMYSADDFESQCLARPLTISMELVRSLLDKKEGNLTSQDFIDARAKVIEIFLEEFTTPWENIRYFYEMSKDQGHAFSVFDSIKLFDQPEKHIAELTKRIGVTYTPAMINNWTKCTKDKFTCIITRAWGDFANSNAWNGDVRNSTGIMRHKDSMQKRVDIAQFPSEVRQFIEQQITSYKQMLGGRERH